MQNNLQRLVSVTGIDGEGITLHGGKDDGKHLYTLLVSYDSESDSYRYSDDWENGLSTQRIFDHLLHYLPISRTGYVRGNNRESTDIRIHVAYYFNYDVTMWIRDIPDDAKKALWISGWTMYNPPEKPDVFYYLSYIPNKIFYLAELNRFDAADLSANLQAGESAPTMWKWPYDGPHTLIFDVSGFSQQSFVKTMKEWDVSLDNLATIDEMKKERSQFTSEEREQITDYCVAECAALCQIVKRMDETFKSEGIRLTSWHGGGALASYFLKQHEMDKKLGDPYTVDSRQAALHAYFGGRTETFEIGSVGKIHNYDLSSAYPYAITLLPDLMSGRWERVVQPDFTRLGVYRYSLWRVTWNTSHLREGYREYGPLPVRRKGRVYWPCSGQTWAHGCELFEAMKTFGVKNFYIHEGWVFHPDSGSEEYPFGWVQELASRRVMYKQQNDRRAIPYKFGLNSLYGKLAQHSVDSDRLPPYQTYYGAGLITAITRTLLMRFVFDHGHDASDLVMLATDGVFCRRTDRTYRVGKGLGEFDYNGDRHLLLIQPGVWWASDGLQKKTRGFHKTSVDYEQALAVWNNDGMYGGLVFTETRFVGLGSCVGHNDFSRYGRWITEARSISFYPENKILYPQSGALSYRLNAPALDDELSDAYVPANPNDPEQATLWLADMLEWYQQADMPDISDS